MAPHRSDRGSPRPIRAAFVGAAAVVVACAGTPAAGDADPGDLIKQVRKLLGPAGGANDEFGYAGSVSGDFAVVGARFDDVVGTDSGSAHVFARDAGGTDNWGLVATLTRPDAWQGDQFGAAVSVSGDLALVGSHQDDDAGSNSGSAYVFARDAGGADNWGFVKKLVAPDAAADDVFGFSVAISGDAALVGTHLTDDAGSASGCAYVFHRDAGGPDNWGFVKKLAAPDAAADDFFGYAVSLGGDIALIGSRWDDDSGEASGSAYVFARDAGGADNWGFVEKLVAPDAAGSDFFGSAVSVDGATAAVGSLFDDDAGSSSGSAYVYERDAGGADNWGFVRKVTAPDGAAGDQFGVSVSVSGGALIVGSHLDVASVSSGSAYVFARDAGGAGNWGLVRMIVPADGAASDRFGFAVSLDGGTALLSAHWDDDLGSASGSARVYDGVKEAAVLAADCDADGASDAVAWAMGMVADCNDNGRPDSCDIADGTSLDADSDDVPDECQATCLGDLNGDNTVDTADLGLLIARFGTLCVP